MQRKVKKKRNNLMMTKWSSHKSNLEMTKTVEPLMETCQFWQPGPNLTIAACGKKKNVAYFQRRLPLCMFLIKCRFDLSRSDPIF